MNKGLRFWCAVVLALLLPLKAAVAAGMACHLRAAEAAQAHAHPCHAMAPQGAESTAFPLPDAAAQSPAHALSASLDDVVDADAASALVCAAACSAPPLPGVSVADPAGPRAGHDWRERPVMPPGSVDPFGLEKPPRSP
jgi:hypothetical protein